MAGRGCTIVVKLLGGSSGNSVTEDISLPVALHSPLQVLKEQLASLVQISTADQVLILCDLNDLERNSDKLLSGSEFSSLRDCGIRNGSVLTLHALGMCAEKKQTMARDALNSKVVEVESKEKVYTLDTETTAAEANHSYNGVIFDVASNGPFEVEIISVSLAGMLGRVRIYARDRPWEEHDGEEPQVQNQHWWAHREALSKDHWVQVADVRCRPAWDKPVEIKFTRSVTLLPHSRRALYCHSSLPDDLGIQYQSYPAKSPFAGDEHVTLFSGLGHTGSVPFDDTNGWYRGGRGLAGALRYHMRYKGWTVFEHSKFPQPLREAVRTMLLCQNRDVQSAVTIIHSSSSSRNCSSSGAPLRQEEEEEEVQRTQQNSSSSSSSSSSSIFERSISSLRQLVTTEPSSSSLFRSQRIVTRDDSSLDALTTRPSSSLSSSGCPADLVLRLRRLHVHLVYNILEFMHWDWFEECEMATMAVEQDDEEDEEALRYGKKRVSESAHSARQNYINNYIMTLLAGQQGLTHMLPGNNHNQQLAESDYEAFFDQEEDEEDEDYLMDDEEEDDEEDVYETMSETNSHEEEEEEEEDEEDEGDVYSHMIRSHSSLASTVATAAETASLAASLAAYANRSSTTSNNIRSVGSSTNSSNTNSSRQHASTGDYDGAVELSSEDEREVDEREVDEREGEESVYETVSEGEEEEGL